MDIAQRYQFRRVINAIGTSTITGANVVAPEVIAAAAEAMGMNMHLDDLQRAASRLIARLTGAEAGCVTSSAASGIAVAVAAAMTGADLARVMQLPDTQGLRDELLIHFAHDVNFGARISQMARLAGAKVIHFGTVNHADAFHLRGAIGPRTAALLFVVNSAVPPGDFIPLEQCAEIAAAHGVPLIVDAAAEPDVRPFLRAGAGIVIAGGHKAMAAPTSGLLCGRKDLLRACYLQNWGIGRAMKVGKEGIVGLMAAMERWYARDAAADDQRFAGIAAALGAHRRDAHRAEIDVAGSARRIANLLREGDPPVWVHDAPGTTLVLDLRALSLDEARLIAQRIAELQRSSQEPREDVPYHDLYWSECRLLSWPD